MFEVGSTYKTQSGSTVKIVIKNGDTVLGSDGIWRYNRPQDDGRVTGPAFDMNHPLNLIPPSNVQIKEIDMYKVEVVCKHCWHGTGIHLCSMPPKAEEICCWCGTKRYLQVFPAVELGENHGPHKVRMGFI